ncbi:MAG: YoaK family protein [Sterolibacterium sp.]
MNKATSLPDNSPRQAWVLAVVAGFSDTVGFLAFGAFAGLMSGNTVLLGIALAAGRLTDALHSMAIISAFLTGIAAATFLSRRAFPLAGFVAVEAAILVIAALLPTGVAAPMLGLAMGIQNAMATHFGGLTLNTVFLTGDLQKLIQALIDRITRKSELKAGPDHSGIIALLWFCYLSGAALGAAAHAWLARPLLLAPLLLLLVLFRSRRLIRQQSKVSVRKPGCR